MIASKEFFDLASNAVRKAGNLIKDAFYSIKTFEKKGARDLVTEIDKESERIITSAIFDAFPDHDVLAEELYSKQQGSPYKWILDPLDGTTNFVHSIPFVAISLALEYQREIILGIVYNPVLNEFFYAIKGQGTYQVLPDGTEKKLSVSSRNKLIDSVIATGFPYEGRGNIAFIVETLESFLAIVGDIRRCGAAAIDLAYLAKGIFDGFYEVGLKPWDTAAGYLIVKEAGGIVTNFTTNTFDYNIPQIIAANPYIYPQMHEIIKSSLIKYPL